MRIRLLGPCQVLWQDEPFALSRRQFRALLYRLAAETDGVSREQLLFLFWPDAPPALARRHLTRLLSGLRAALPQKELLQVSEETISLKPDLIEVDSRRFEMACTADDLAALQAAVRLYNGPFLAGFSLPRAPEYEAWQEQTARRLEGLYLATLARLTQLLGASGEITGAIACAREYLETDELDETMHRRLIALYIAAGRRTAALRQYEQCALVLERELGVNPLPETRAALLPPADRPARSHVPPSPRSSEPPFIGRETALAQLRAACERLSSGGLILIRGEPGIGKSRLLREFSAAQDAQLLHGNAHPGAQSLPFQPLIQALRSRLNDRALWSNVPALWRSELLPLLPELRAQFPTLSAPLRTAPDQAQGRLLEAVTQTMAALPHPVLLCLDDLQWADEATLGWLRYLAGRWEEVGLVIIATTWTRSSPGLDAVRHAWQRANRYAASDLAGLSAVAVAELLRRLPAPPRIAARIHAITEGNPFFILEIIRHLRETGRSADAAEDSSLPETVRDAILARLSFLSPLARQLLESAVVLAPHVDDQLLQQTAARTASEVADALDELFAHQLLKPAAPPAPESDLRLGHYLLQTVVYQELSPWRRRLLHGRAGAALTRLRPANAAVLAQHFAQAASWERAFVCYQEAATQAEQAHAYDVALEQIDHAFAILGHLSEPKAARLTLLRRRLALARILVQLPTWRADAEEVRQLAEQAGATEALLEALESQMSLHVLQSHFGDVEATAARALTLATKSGNRVAAARIRQTLGWHLADALGRSRAGLVHLQEARRLAEEAGEQHLLYQILCHLAFALRAEGRCAAARDSAHHALTLTRYRPGDLPHPDYADALRELAEANAYLGRWEEAWQTLQSLKGLYHTLQDPWAYGAVLFNFGLYSANIGQHEKAIAAMRQLVRLSEKVGLPADSDYGIWHRSGLARTLLAAGQVDEAGALLGGLHTGTLQPGRPYLAWARTAAEYHLALGDPVSALAVLQRAVAWWRQSASLHDADVLLQLALAAHAAGMGAVAQRSVVEATTLLETTDIHRYQLRLYAARHRVLGDPRDLASARAALAVQAAAFSDPALRHAFEQNVALHREIAG